jgi:hypothetical protein
VTIKDKIVTQTKDKIDSAFDDITKALGQSTSTQLKSSSLVTGLTAALNSTDVSQTIIADSSRLQNDPRYSAMVGTSLSIGLITTASCPNFSVSGVTVPGILDFMDKLDDMGTVNVLSSSTCAKQVVCTNPTDATCAAGNNFMQLKNQLLSDPIFNCMLFEDAGGAVCDPRNADCLRSDGTVQTKNVPCNLSSYGTYIGLFPDRIDSVITQLDSNVVNGLDKINKDMRRIVMKYLVDPVEEVANGVRCGFLGKFYREVVEAFCYQGIYGFRIIGWSYASSGILTIFFIVLMFAVWRRLIDNVNLWKPEDTTLVVDCSERPPHTPDSMANVGPVSAKEAW